MNNTTHHLVSVRDTAAASKRILKAMLMKGVKGYHVSKSFDTISIVFEIANDVNVADLEKVLFPYYESRYVSPTYFNSGNISSIYESRQAQLMNNPTSGYLHRLREIVREEFMNVISDELNSTGGDHSILLTLRRAIRTHARRTNPR